MAASASVRATSTVGTLQTSAASRAATSLLIASWVGTSTLPPMWPHFFAEESWSSKCTPAAPASIICFISSKAFSTPPKPASASATMGFSQSIAVVALGVMNLIRAPQRRVDPPHDRGHRVGRIERLVRVHLAGEIGIRRDLPAGQVDRIEPGLHLLHRLVAGERAERVDERLLVQIAPQLLGRDPRDRVLHRNRAAQAHHVLRRGSRARCRASAGSRARCGAALRRSEAVGSLSWFGLRRLSVEQVVGGKGQELVELVLLGHLLEEPRGGRKHAVEQPSRRRPRRGCGRAPP